MHTVPSASPRSLRVTKVSPFSVALAWKAPPRNSQNGVIIGYTVGVFQTANDSTYNYTSDTTFMTVPDLDDDTTYNFTVAAKTAVGLGPYSTHVMARTRNYGETIKAIYPPPPNKATGVNHYYLYVKHIETQHKLISVVY